MCVIAVAFAGWNARYAGHHVAIGRDPGVYAVTGKWIATHGNLQVHTGLEWSSKSSDVTAVYGGSYAQGPDITEFQFDHLTPVLLALGDNIGGDSLMFRVPALVGALALCAIYAVGCRIARRPWMVVAAVAALAVSLPELNVVRDTFSEPAVELLLWSGLWLLILAYEKGRLGVALLAGAALAGTSMSRIDAPIYLIPLPLLAALTWLSVKSVAERGWLVRMYGVFLLGAVPVAVLGTIDVQDRAGRYYDDLHQEVHQLQVGLEVSIILGLAAIAVWPLVRSRLTGIRGWMGAHRDPIGTACGLVVVLGMIGTWAIRPAVMHAHTSPVPLVGGLQALEGLAVDPTRSYAEQSVVWLGWYLGPITIALATLAAAVMLSRIVRKPDAGYVLVLAVGGMGTALYLWHPSIVPDQIWASRRFVPAAMPLFALLAAAAVGMIADCWSTRTGRVTAAVPILTAGAAVLIAFPLAVTIPVRNFQPESGYLAGINTACQATGPQVALLTAPNDFLSQELVGALRSWCGVPVATMTHPFSAAQIQKLATEWSSQGRTLWVIGSTPAAVTGAGPGLSTVLLSRLTSPNELEATLSRPPQRYAPSVGTIYGVPVIP
jgi:hypothetical protein